MDHLMVQVTSFKVVGPYTLLVAFSDDTEQIINFEPVLFGYYYAPLRDLELFNQVRLDTETRTLIWPNDADFDPATLHSWNQGDGAELAQKVRQWQKSSLQAA